MLGRLLLIIVQLVVGWYAGLELLKYLPNVGDLNLFLIAGLFAFLVWAIGLLAAAVLKDVSQPGPSSLLFAFAAAMLFAVLTLFPEVTTAVASVARGIEFRMYPLVGAVIGYAIQS